MIHALLQFSRRTSVERDAVNRETYCMYHLYISEQYGGCTTQMRVIERPPSWPRGFPLPRPTTPHLVHHSIITFSNKQEIISTEKISLLKKPLPRQNTPHEKVLMKCSLQKEKYKV